MGRKLVARALVLVKASAGPNADMCPSRETAADVTALYRRVWVHSDAIVHALDVNALGHVPWWPEAANRVTLHRMLVHVNAETHRHAGHVDIVREQFDGAAGLRPEASNLPDGDVDFSGGYRARLQDIADTVGRVPGPH